MAHVTDAVAEKRLICTDTWSAAAVTWSQSALAWERQLFMSPMGDTVHFKHF